MDGLFLYVKNHPQLLRFDGISHDINMYIVLVYTYIREIEKRI